MREKRTTYEVEEKEEEEVYCDICGAKTDQSRTLYTSSRQLKHYPIKSFINDPFGEGAREGSDTTMCAYDVCEDCMDNMGSGYDSSLYLYKDEKQEQEHSPLRNNNFILSVSALVLGCAFAVLSISNHTPEILYVTTTIIFFTISAILVYKS